MLELPRAQTLSYVFAAQTSHGKLPDGPEPVVVDVDYVASSQLLPFESNTVSEQLQVGILSPCETSSHGSFYVPVDKAWGTRRPDCNTWSPKTGLKQYRV